MIFLAACGSSDSGSGDEETTTIKVGASSTPHAEILKEAQPILEKEGVNLEIEEYQDYVLPNDDLSSGDLDANYFQHIPYLETSNADTGYDLISLGAVHLEPMGVYSKNIKKVDDIKDGTEVIMGRNVSEQGRILSIFQEAGLITIKDGVEPVDATLDDIGDNPKNLKFSMDIDPAFLPDTYESEGDALVVINTNYALQAGLTPSEDALILEGTDSPYGNIVAARAEDKDNEALKKLMDVLHSDEIKQFIEDNYDGAILPVDK
ncbi:methionine ABC transporter substrate-binding protein [Terribacillus saccharophilus]|uniref:Methionine ABC transporter substrate-binding protein n=2 Tax=Terribacillus saccharophilus TaxID=361277 RepID=A0A268AFZ8_9BACI|nr:methionine ABC transporter substrate-binding protein [Terribacillus saccharophilus]PAF18028.1 methionine ABC transporter substrate-binding protein [Terribacillus saccharophilus]PAF22958.1 methionine ABC transporter substrate-binding protein [Terribacillus saccharophilus]PAF37632.1 methionine ABC transporter substrate-binding protein [Terribacillus saccharophilus]PAF37677.1 methionine ABC transporter substrate-binding protein [Terribacillus saccharophilus]